MSAAIAQRRPSELADIITSIEKIFPSHFGGDENAAALVGSDRDPLIFLVDRVFDEKLDIQTRVGCAAIATKYLHPTLSASSVAATHTVVKVDPGELLNRIAERISKQTNAATTIEHEAPEQADPVAA